MRRRAILWRDIKYRENKIFVDYTEYSGYNKSTIAYPKYTEVFYYG